MLVSSHLLPQNKEFYIKMLNVKLPLSRKCDFFKKACAKFNILNNMKV